MLTTEDNELLTRTGPGTPMGELFRQFWQPALLSLELPAADCPPVRIRVLGEDLVAFRDSDGVPGVIDAPTGAPASSSEGTRSLDYAVSTMAGSST